ncbi:MAG: type II toxin-antitoxin system VapC family toxin [Candidatus Binatia bacterium]
MRLLLDTHAFLWIANGVPTVPPRVLAAYRDRSNEVLLSVVSAWEIQVKVQVGKLELDDPLADLIATERDRNALKILPVELGHVFALGDLATHHRDPFDRLLVAQAIAENAKLVTADPELAKYPVEILW